MNLKRTWLAVPAVVALSLTACAGGSTGGSASSDGSGGIVTAYGSEPQNPLIPANTNENGGGRIVDSLFSRLTYYKADGSSQNDVAESITTEDSKLWTVKLHNDRKFSDGTPVMAKNFVEAWKMAAKESMNSVNFFEPIMGADDEGAGDLTGLKVVDDYTFTIELKQPTADFAGRLGYTAFSPLPDSTLADPKKGGEHPVGNGPYMVASDTAWEHNVKISLVPNPHYKGDLTPKNKGVDIVFYSSLDAAYADLTSGTLDVLDSVPSSVYTTYESELQGRTVNQPAAVFQSFVVPDRLEHFGGEEGKLRRQALSYAINRDEITKTIFAGTRTPAKDFTSPVVDGYKDNLPGSEVLKYNPAKAKELWAKADAISPWSGTFKLAYNSDGGHSTWVDAVTNSIKNTLGIAAEGNPYADFKSLRNDVSSRSIATAFRTGWQGDYPGMFNFLSPLYVTGAGSNDGPYSNPEFDGLMRKAAAATTSAESIKIMDQAQEILLKDLPVIPLWYANTTGGWSDKVSNVVFNWNSTVTYANVVKK